MSGAARLSVQRPRLQGRLAGWHRRRLADRVCRPRAVPDIVESHIGVSGRENYPWLPDGTFQPPMPMTCPERAVRPCPSEAGSAGHDRAHRQPHRAAERPRVLPLLRAVRAWLHDALVLQLDVHDRGRRPCDRQADAHHRRDGASRVDGSGEASGRRRRIRGSRDACRTRRARARRHPLRADVRVDPSAAELVVDGFPRGPWQLEWARRQVPAGALHRRRRIGRVPRVSGASVACAARRPNGIYVPRFRNVPGTPASGFLRGYGYQGNPARVFALGAGYGHKKAIHDSVASVSLQGFGGACRTN